MIVVLTFVTFIVMFGILVFVHELGHFSFAKAFRMPVEEFAFGFWKKLVVLARRSGTEYTIRAIPIGGFVRISGMDDFDGAEISETPRPLDSFNRRPIYQRFAVIFAGPAFSLIFGYLLYVVLAASYGVPVGPAKNRIGLVDPSMPAAKAGIALGDTVLSVNGKPIENGEQMVKAIRESGGTPITLQVRGEKDGAPVRSITVTPTVIDDNGTRVSRIGIAAEPSDQRRRTTVPEAFGIGWENTKLYFQTIGEIFRQGKAREGISGPVGIVRTVGQTVDKGLGVQLGLMAQFSLSLGAANLLPIPIFDGGHLLLLLVEALRRRRMTVTEANRVYTAGFAIVAALFALVMFNDLSKLFQKG